MTAATPSTTPNTTGDIAILRELAKEYKALTDDPKQDERRTLWRNHNSLIRTRPLIYVREGTAWNEIIPQSALRCEDRIFRGVERYLRKMLFQDTVGDDYILEPWIPVPAAIVLPKKGHWGVAQEVDHSGDGEGQNFYNHAPLKDPDEIENLVVPKHEIDEDETKRRYEKVADAIGDVIDVAVLRAPFYHGWHGDIATDIAQLRGLEQIMLDVYLNPEWYKRLLAFMRDGILKAQGEAEAAGDWHLTDHNNQAMSYAKELADPAAGKPSVTRKELWVHVAAQEYAQISPEHHDEFMLEYQLPIMEHFGLVAYGCCEDLTKKIDILRKVKNLRRIAVSPWADIRSCAEQIGEDYVYSWRPNPARMVCCGFDEESIRRDIRDALTTTNAYGCHVDITLKDIQTVEGHPERLAAWTRIVREVIDETL